MNDPESRYAAWFHELDAWTEYWDIYHPESKGRYYFGDGNSERGLLTILLPHHARPAVFTAWTAWHWIMERPASFYGRFA